MNADDDSDLEVVLRSTNDTSAGARNVLAIIDDADYTPEVNDFQHEYVLTEIM